MAAEKKQDAGNGQEQTSGTLATFGEFAQVIQQMRDSAPAGSQVQAVFDAQGGMKFKVVQPRKK